MTLGSLLRLRALRLALAALVLAAVAGCTFLLLRPTLESSIRARLAGEARRLGLSLTLGGVRLTPRLSVELSDLVLETARLRGSTHHLVVSPRLSWRGLVGRAARVDVSQGAIELPGGLRVELQPSSWIVERGAEGLRVARVASGQRLEVLASRAGEVRALRVTASGARLDALAQVLWHGCAVARLGTVDGEARVEERSGTVRVDVRGRGRSLEIASWAGTGESCRDGGFGAPTDASLEANLVVDPAQGSLRADAFRATAGGVQAHGRLSLEGGLADPRIDLELEVPRLAFARLFATAGLDLRADDLGSAALGIGVRGPLLDPAALAVTQHLDFTPPARPLPAIERLRGPFLDTFETEDGRTRQVRVSPDSPDFVALADVPPLFLRTLLVAEDANFYGHPGIDLAELPVAVATNLARGGFARGASTISQQLAKNLFLSRRKTLGRKLEEASLALLLDSALGKSRELEIYLNVIEWGPDLYGLRPAARHYFGVEPAALTPKQMVFLVSLIPGPLKYQRSFANGVPTPFLDGLMTTLLTKLLSLGAITEAEYAEAVAEPLALRSAGASRTPGSSAPWSGPGEPSLAPS